MKTVNYKRLITLIAVLISSIYITGCAGPGYRGGYGYGPNSYGYGPNNYGGGLHVGAGTATGVAAGAAVGAMTSRNGWAGAAKGGLIGGAAGLLFDTINGNQGIGVDNGYNQYNQPQQVIVERPVIVERQVVQQPPAYYQQRVYPNQGNYDYDDGNYQNPQYFQPRPRYCDPCRR